MVADATDTQTTTTMGHNAKANGVIEVFWRFWNRCMRLLPDDQYRKWPQLAARICFAYNTAAHESLGNISPFELYHGVAARNPLTAELHARAIDDELPTVDLDDPAAFATAVRTSAAAFTRLAAAHTDYVRTTTAARLNQVGHPTTFAIGDRVKIFVPPSHDQMVASGRRSSHLSAWRGPCIITARLSPTAYKMQEVSTSRDFERIVSNILPYRATTAKAGDNFNPVYSDPFTVGECIAVRDDPNSMFYLALVTGIAASSIAVHYHGCTHRTLDRAVFKPAWHLPQSNEIVLSVDQPALYMPYSGSLQLDALQDLLVARGLEFTKARKLRKISQRAIAPLHDELFIFDK